MHVGDTMQVFIKRRALINTLKLSPLTVSKAELWNTWHGSPDNIISQAQTNCLFVKRHEYHLKNTL